MKFLVEVGCVKPFFRCKPTDCSGSAVSPTKCFFIYYFRSRLSWFMNSLVWKSKNNFSLLVFGILRLTFVLNMVFHADLHINCFRWELSSRFYRCKSVKAAISINIFFCIMHLTFTCFRIVFVLYQTSTSNVKSHSEEWNHVFRNGFTKNFFFRKYLCFQPCSMNAYMFSNMVYGLSQVLLQRFRGIRRYKATFLIK